MSYKAKYKSCLGATRLITAPNYLAEQIIHKRASKKGIRLPDAIWNPKYRKDLRYKYWCNAYMGEVTKAASLLKQFDEDCVIQALKSPECDVILSLQNEKLERKSRELQDKKTLAEKNKETVELNVVSPDTLPRKRLGKKSKLGKLK